MRKRKKVFDTPEFKKFGRLLDAGLKDCDKAPKVNCPACNNAMNKVVGLGRLHGYKCGGYPCVMSGREITVEQLSDAVEWQLFCEEARIHKHNFEEMRKRNGAHESNDRGNFDAIRSAFIKQWRLPDDFYIVDQTSTVAVAWRKHLADNSDHFCSSCHAYHRPTTEHPLCKLCRNSVHAPAPRDIYFIHRGWKFTPPFVCMACGVEICFRQWAFSRSCGSCDLSKSNTRRLFVHKCFAGPHEQVGSPEDRAFILAEYFVDPRDRNKYPVLTAEQERRMITSQIIKKETLG